jgi:BirA family biotin operon repressor/biotin-[acetyl-CoA-carboxylase] ligase
VANADRTLLTETQRHVVRTLADGRPRSGLDLAGQTGLSRSGIWKVIQQLRDLGLPIAAVPGVGYRLARPIELLDPDMIRSRLEPAAACLLGEIYLAEVLASTNTYLREEARRGAPAGSVCLTEMQTAGRGRLGRVWQSPFAGNIYLSVLARFASPAALAGLSLAVGVLVTRALRVAGAAGVGLKWPNDVLWQGGKLGGVLIEIGGEMHGPCAVTVGIGINCWLPQSLIDQIDQPVATLSKIPGMEGHSRNGLVAGVLNELLPALAAFEHQGLQHYAEEWTRYHVHQGLSVRLDTPAGSVRGTARGVDASGALLLGREDGTVGAYSTGDVSLRPDSP